MPPFEEKVQVFGNMSDELVAKAKRVLMVAEFVDWKWTFKQILEQDEALTDAVMYMKSIGERFRMQGRKPLITRVKDWFTGNG